MISAEWRNAEFEYDPYPIGLVRPFFAEDLYERAAAAWPAFEKFAFMPTLGKKYSLSERNHPEVYREVVGEGVWKEVHDFLKSREFVVQALTTLAERRIDLGLLQGRLLVNERPGVFSRAVEALRGGGARRLKTRFEFSMLPADGGHIKPHTDAPGKIVTLVVSMCRPGEWRDAHGGGTAVQKPKDVTRSFNHLNQQMEFDQVETVRVFPFEPNQCVMFVKTFNSLHAVEPMTGVGSNAMRRTLTVNIEEVS